MLKSAKRWDCYDVTVIFGLPYQKERQMTIGCLRTVTPVTQYSAGSSESPKAKRNYSQQAKPSESGSLSNFAQINSVCVFRSLLEIPIYFGRSQKPTCSQKLANDLRNGMCFIRCSTALSSNSIFFLIQR